MTEPAKCHCGSISWERKIEENRYICASCKRPLWQPIETAPKDGTHFLAYWTSSEVDGHLKQYHVCHYGYGVLWPSWIKDNDMPTHWMPMPEGPGDE